MPGQLIVGPERRQAGIETGEREAPVLVLLEPRAWGTR
jgi:hypothetical protein